MEGRKIVITDGTSDIGKSIALYLAQQNAGHIVITFDSDEKEAEKIVNQIRALGVKANAIYADLLEKKDREKVVKDSYQILNDVDVLVNHSSRHTKKCILDLTDDEIKEEFKENVMAPFYFLREFGLKMKNIQNNQLKVNDYCIINITSMNDKMPPGAALFESTKAALHKFTQIAAHEFSVYKIRVNDIAPGYVARSEKKGNFGFLENRKPSMGLMVARVIETILKNSWITGSTFDIDSGKVINCFNENKYQQDKSLVSQAKL